MPKRRITPRYIADHVRRILKDGGSAPHAEGVQHFFREEIKSRGWYTAELRKVAVRFRRTIQREQGTNFLVKVADDLVRGEVLEEKVFGVYLLQTLTEDFGESEFRLFESWTLTNGQLLRLFITYVIAFLIALAVSIAVGILAFIFLGVVGGSQLLQILPLFRSDPATAVTQLLGLLPSLIIAGAVVGAISTPILTAVYYCPAAFIYARQMGRKEDVF